MWDMITAVLVCWLVLVQANVEKTIFVTPAAQVLPHDASIDNLYLTRLSERVPRVRTYINATFPTPDEPKGTETWMLLEELRPKTRYEVRLCWLATQPTSFTLYTHTVESVFETPALLSSLSAYAYTRYAERDEQALHELHPRPSPRPSSSSRQQVDTTFVFLQILAAADYFSLDDSLMEHVPAVMADVILDPYLFNIFPQSLVPTTAYLVLVAGFAWFFSGRISSFILALAGHDQAPGRASERMIKKSQ